MINPPPSFTHKHMTSAVGTKRPASSQTNERSVVPKADAGAEPRSRRLVVSRVVDDVAPTLPVLEASTGVGVLAQHGAARPIVELAMQFVPTGVVTRGRRPQQKYMPALALPDDPFEMSVQNLGKLLCYHRQCCANLGAQSSRPC